MLRIRGAGLVGVALFLVSTPGFSQNSCATQLRLTSDYSLVIASSPGSGAYTFSDGGHVIAQGPQPQLALFHYDSGLNSTSGITTSQMTGATTVPGKFGSALSMTPGGRVSYPAAGNLSFADGTIELWIAPTKDGTDPIYTKYDHSLLRYTSAAGDQLVMALSASGGTFYNGMTVNKTFIGTGGVSASSLKAGAWHHVAMTYSKSRGRVRFYFDGSVISERDATLAMPAADGPSFTVDSDPYGNASAFLVDELRISQEEKTAAQIAYDAGRATPFADNEVIFPLAGVANGQLAYSAEGCSAANYSWNGLPLTSLTPAGGLLPPNATSVGISFQSAQPASCAYSAGSQLPFTAMQPFTTGQKTTKHLGAVGGLSPDPRVINNVYIQCDSNPDFVQTLQFRAVGARNGTFPRIGNIWIGSYILNNSPANAAKTQLWLGPGSISPTQAAALRAQEPTALILPSVNAQETTNGTPVVPSDYLLRDVNGKTIEDWPGNFRLNLTKPEVGQFLAQYAYQQYFTNNNLAYDGIFWDNFHPSVSNSTYDYLGVLHQIDANGDGIPDDQATLNTAWSKGIYNLITAFDALAPNAYVAGHVGQIPPAPASLQSFHGESFTFNAVQVREGAFSFDTLLATYNQWMSGGRQPAIATIQSSPPSQIGYGYGYQPLQHMLPSTIQFAQTFYPNMRFGLAMALMNDGFFIHDWGDIGAPVSWWYDEYDFNLGSPTGAAAEYGVSGSPAATSLVSNGGLDSGLTGWSLLVNNDGQAHATVQRDTTIAASGTTSALIQVAATGTAQWHVDFEQANLPLTATTAYKVRFWARADAPRSITVFTQGGAPNFPGYGLSKAVPITTSWQYFEISFTAPLTAKDGRLEFWCGDQTGSVWLDDIAMIPTDPAVPEIYRRDFTNGIVLLNGTPSRQTVTVEPGFRKFNGTQAPAWQYIVDDSNPDFTADSSWQSVTIDTGLTDYNFSIAPASPNPPFYHAWNYKAHQQTKPGAAAQWNLNIPADGAYTIQVWLPAAPDAATWAKSAVYEIVAGGNVVATATLDQTAAGAGDAWHLIATVNLTQAGAPILRVHNSGAGTLIADGVYIASVALLNDGGAVGQITLSPYDGILLMRETPLAGAGGGVTSVAGSADYRPAIASGGFFSITGNGLADTARLWAASDFQGSGLPQMLDGVTVSVNGNPALIEYVSPTQVNAIAPDDPLVGPVKIQVTTPQGAVYSTTVLKQNIAPSFFTYPSDGVNFVAARHLDGSLVGPASAGARPAVPGEVISIYGTGLGATNPASPSEQIDAPAPIAATAAVSIGGVTAPVSYAGLVAPGLYQINAIVPPVASGNLPVQVSASGFQGVTWAMLAVNGN